MESEHDHVNGMIDFLTFAMLGQSVHATLTHLPVPRVVRAL